MSQYRTALWLYTIVTDQYYYICYMLNHFIWIFLFFFIYFMKVLLLTAALFLFCNCSYIIQAYIGRTVPMPTSCTCFSHGWLLLFYLTEEGKQKDKFYTNKKCYTSDLLFIKRRFFKLSFFFVFSILDILPWYYRT